MSDAKESDFVRQHLGGGYSASDQSIETKTAIRDPPKAKDVVSKGPSLSNLVTQHSRRTQLQYFGTSTPFEKHQKYISDYIHYYGGRLPSPPKGENDFDILRKTYQFIRDDDYSQVDENEELSDKQKYEAKIAFTYYEKLHKEYALADLSKFETGQIGLCWRTEKQLLIGKGQFCCGNLTCNEIKDLKDFEVNFGYKENGEFKNELVKLCLCPICAYKMNYKRLKDKEKAEKKLAKRVEKKKRKKSEKRARKEEKKALKKQKLNSEENVKN